MSDRLAGLPGPGLFEVSDVNVDASPGFAGWLRRERVGLAFTTGNRLFLVGVDPDGALHIVERAFDAATGLAASARGEILFLASRWQIWRLQDALAAGGRDRDGHDRLYLRQTAHTTGFVGVYDLAVGADGRPVFTNTLFNCLARLSDRLNFTAIWLPPFISGLVAEERCHFTGVAVRDGEPAYVTCAARTDVAGGWRDLAEGGGVLIDARTGQTVLDGLTLPFSPRLDGGQLFVTNGGTGELLAVEVQSGSARAIARVPGLARGVAFHGQWAVVGCSQLREDGPYQKNRVW